LPGGCRTFLPAVVSFVVFVAEQILRHSCGRARGEPDRHAGDYPLRLVLHVVLLVRPFGNAVLCSLFLLDRTGNALGRLQPRSRHAGLWKTRGGRPPHLRLIPRDRDEKLSEQSTARDASEAGRVGLSRLL
jgi:hypothetical protein